MSRSKTTLTTRYIANFVSRLIILAFTFLFEIAYSSEFTYPQINLQGKDIKGFIPNGWSLMDSTSGDLNKDLLNDLVLVIQHNESVKLVKDDSYDNEGVLTQPRILIILFYNPSTNQFQLAEQSNSFILDHHDPNMEDPYSDVSIKSGVLQIDFQIFMNMGSWSTTSGSYKFRYQDKKEFALIGAEYTEVHRGSGEMSSRSYNFITQKAKVSTGSVHDDYLKDVWHKIQIDGFKTLKTFIRPFSWEVEKGFFI